MALKLKYTDEHGILHINMSPTSSPRVAPDPENSEKTESIVDPKFDTINNRFGQYDLFGGKYEGGEQSLFRSRYNSIEEELANTPYAFTTERSLRANSASSPILDITINRTLSDDTSPSKDIEDDRFFHKNYDSLFGPQIDLKTSIKTSDEEEAPAFTVTQLIHAQDRYFDLSSRHSSSVVDSPRSEVRTVRTQVRTSAQDRAEPVRTVRGSVSARTGVRSEESARKKEKDGAFKVLASEVKTITAAQESAVKLPAVPTAKRKREKSFVIITETPVASRPSSPRSLPVEIRTERRSPFRGRGFREETSRHSTPRASATNSRANSPPRRRTRSLSRIDKMATATLPPPMPHSLSRPHSPKNFVKQNIEEVRELSELNREKHEAEAEKKRREEEEALLKEMGLFEKNAKSDAIRSIVCSRTNSRSNSPSKARLRSRSTSPAAAQAPSAIIHFENIPAEGKEYVNMDDGMPVPPVRPSRVRVAKSQPQSNDGSPKHSKIPKRQNSVSPTRNDRRNTLSNKIIENNLNKNQRFISNSTSSIHETIRIGSQAHDKRGMSKSTQFLNISPKHIKGKPPISPGRVGPPPSNKYINPKRLSPIVGTPNKSPVEGSKPASARTPTKPSPVTRKPVKTAGNTPATSRLNSRQPSRAVSRDPSPDKRRTVTKSSLSKSTTNLAKTRPASRAVSTKTPQKPMISSKPEPKKPINRTSSMKSLTKTPSMKNLNEKQSSLKKRDSNKDLTQSTNKSNDVGTKKETDDSRKSPVKMDTGKNTLDRKSAKKDKVEQKSNQEPTKEQKKEETKKTNESSNSTDEVMTQDNETQYDKITNDKGELIILTKKNIVSMTTAAITAQPLEVVTTVTNQLPAALEKAREKGIFERHGSKDSLAPKDDSKLDAKEAPKTEVKDEDKKPVKPERTIFAEDNVKLKPLLPPYNNPQVERVKQKIDDILKSPEVSSENIIVTAPVIKPNENVTKTMSSFKSIADKTKNDIKQSKDGVATKLTNLKDELIKQNEKSAADIRSEATKIVNSIITPVEEPKDIIEKAKLEAKKDIEPIVMVVNEKKKNPMKNEIVEKMTETLVKGEPEVEVQSSNVSTPGKMGALNRVLASKMAESDSDKSQSNGGFPQSTSTTPKPPARANRSQKEGSDGKSDDTSKESSPDTTGKKPNLCQRLMGKCKSKCCPCCIKPEDDETEKALTPPPQEKKGGVMNKLNCFKKTEDVESLEKAVSHEDVERAAGKAASIEFESETKPKRKLRDILCGCCSKRRVSAVPEPLPRDVTSGEVGEAGCCGRRREVERRDSILSDRPPASLCNSRLARWVRGACRRSGRASPPASRRQSMFSKNKSLSPTLPPEDTRVKLDASLVEHTSVMRGAIPVLPIALAYFCLVCNVIVPGLGTIFSGMFCLCFGIPRFGVHDGARHRIGSFFINLLVGAGQLFTVLFCLVGWGWSIWWGVIMLKISRKYRKLKAEAAAEEAEAAPPVTANNHTRA